MTIMSGGLEPFLESLTGEICKYYTICDSDSTFEAFGQYIGTAIQRSSDFGQDIEIVFRNILSSLIGEKKTTEASNIEKLVIFALGVASRYYSLSPNLGKIPYLLMEDLFDGLSLSDSEKMWTLIESLTDQLTQPELFAKGKFVVLRTCNALLRRLSKSCNTEFCGRVLMFLAAVYPISERSAVNLGGKVNTANETIFEEQATFLQFRDDSTASDASSHMEVEAELKSSVGEAVIKIEATATSLSTSTSAAAVDASAQVPVDHPEYLRYKHFWELQSYMSSELKKIEVDLGLATETPTAALPAPAVSSANASKLKTHFDHVLQLFEDTAIGQSELRQHEVSHAAAKQSSFQSQMHRRAERGDAPLMRKKDDAASTSTAQHSDDYLGCKFLTSSQLFELQLHDPQVRLQVLLQIVIFCHSLRIRLVSTIAGLQASAANLISTATAAAAAAASRKIRSSQQAAAATVTPPAATALLAAATAGETLRSDLLAIKSRAYAQLKMTPPNGAENLASLQRLLRRETQWIAWKANSCQPFEKESAPAAIFVEAANKIIGKNLFIPEMSDNSTKQAGFKRKDKSLTGPVTYRFDMNREKILSVSKDLVIDVPSFEAFFEFFVQAEDPEFGIEEEYHPKKDGVYCWRARRLLAAENLKEFAKMPGGDLAQVVPLFAKTKAEANEGEGKLSLDQPEEFHSSSTISANSAVTPGISPRYVALGIEEAIEAGDSSNVSKLMADSSLVSTPKTIATMSSDVGSEEGQDIEDGEEDDGESMDLTESGNATHTYEGEEGEVAESSSRKKRKL